MHFNLQKQFFDQAKSFHHNNSNKKRKHQQQQQQHNGKKKAKLDRSVQEQLPIYYGKLALLKEVMENDSIVLMSETGSGKTTQLPKYLLYTHLSKKGVICCTQPRRVAAISVAQRVAEETSTKLGDTVGYSVRFEDMTTERTRLKYMTDGMLLREALLDPLLKKYSVIILDEAHERSVQTDVLFGVVKQAQTKRKGTLPLKIVVMSATLHADEFSKYFAAKICFIEGRRYPIKTFYTEEIQKDYPHASLVSAIQLHKTKPLGHDILVFLTGQEEINSIARVINELKESMKQVCGNLLVYPLFSALPTEAQMKAFEKAPHGYRKVILSTNIAETSVTIPGVKYVIDCGMVKQKAYNPSTGFELLKVQPISKAQSRQRCGRAGRECPGECYRLYPEPTFFALDENTRPEIQRCSLRNVALSLLAMGLPDILNFDFMSSPGKDKLEDALKQLFYIGAVESVETQKITEKGLLLSKFPLDPCLTNCILAAKQLGCTEEIVTIVSLMSVESVIYVPVHLREKSRKALQKFSASEGDHVTMLLLFKAYKHAKGDINWCREHFINIRNMSTVLKIRKQLRELCTRYEITLQSCHNDFTVVRKALAAGMFLNSAERERDGTYRTIIHKQPVNIHPSSVLFRAKPSFVIFQELMETSKRFMRDLCVVDPAWLIQACPTVFDSHKLLPSVETS